jgi:hypothetical protein
MRVFLKSAALALIVLAIAAQAQAQPKPPAVPVMKVQAEPLEDTSGPVVVELFTARACPFCPQADRLFAQMTARPNVIGISCPVDYLKSGDDLAQPFCIERQNWYMTRLHFAPAYTPQMIINGTHDILGYRADRIADLASPGHNGGMQLIAIAPLAQGSFNVTLSQTYAVASLQGWQLTVASFRKPVEADAHGEQVNFVRVADNLQVMLLDGYKGTVFQLTVPLKPDDQGFAVFLQRQATGQIMAAGQFFKPR